ncbi:MAG: PAS domain S-box protein [Desulfovibrionales bacterium]|nr:MAG: PAS domain S-box protein [Desulfovibrionales bacterium]
MFDTDSPSPQSSVPSAQDSSPTHYVAIGASAGGLEAIEAFFLNMVPNSGLGFIVVQHLSPDYKSLMKELLSKKTPMPVHRAEEGMRVKADNVYLIPPKKNLSIFHGKLLLSEQDHTRGINLPIDVFLQSLAEDQSERAVAIILSGTGSDGMRGVRVIKEFGGMIMVQSEESAKFDGMPRAAISTGLCDFILPPEEMPGQLLNWVKHPYVSKAERAETLFKEEDGLTRIFSILRERFKVDFTYYKPSTVNRRIERRMTINQVKDIKDYVAFMGNYAGEATALFRELLIGVTSFFRDPQAYDILGKKWLKELIKNTDAREVRFWVAGCSTGEEAYSLAILARECLAELEVSRDIKIFATDIDRDAIHFAANGIYPESIAADVSPQRLAKNFHRRDEHFQISRTIREMVVFAQHNLIKDPPFTNISLISCRNLLIYLQPSLQQKVFEFFNFSLNPAGLLFLGTSETIGDMTEFFAPLDHKWKLYQSKGRMKRVGGPMHLAVSDTRVQEVKGQFAAARKSLQSGDPDKVLERFLDAVSENYIPLALIVNEQMDVLHIIGDSEGYLRLPSGKPTLNVTKMTTRQLSIPMATGIQKVFRQGRDVLFHNLPTSSGHLSRTVNLRFVPLPTSKGQAPLVAVLIEEATAYRPTASDELKDTPCDLSQEAEQRITDLEQELQFSRENLQATIEELETSNEELQATNEELVASNEELQATNEELQSTNEELYTVNAEYQNRIIELTELNHDVNNLLAASMVGKLLLDENLEIRRFSPKVTELFRLIDKDIGRPVSHIVHFLEDIDLLEMIRNVQESSEMVEAEVRSQGKRWYLMRITPYLVGPNVYSGTVLTFVDITKLKTVEQELRESEQRFAAVVNTSPALIWMSGPDKMCTWFNDPWLAFTGRTLQQEVGDGWAEGIHPEDQEQSLQLYSGAFDRREPFEMEYRLRRHDGEYRWILDQGHPRHSPEGKFIGYIGSCLDITELKKAETALRAERMQIFSWFDDIDECIYAADKKTHEILYANKAMELSFGEDLVGKPCHERIQGTDHPCGICADRKSDDTTDRVRVGTFQENRSDSQFKSVDKIIHWHDGREACLRYLKIIASK